MSPENLTKRRAIRRRVFRRSAGKHPREFENRKKLVQTMNAFLSKILQISESSSYLTPVLSGPVVSHFKYGPLGELLRQNIHNEWIFSNVTCRDVNVFPFSRTDANGTIEGRYIHDYRTITTKTSP